VADLDAGPAQAGLEQRAVRDVEAGDGGHQWL
jgi:hypothetical protein